MSKKGATTEIGLNVFHKFISPYFKAHSLNLCVKTYITEIITFLIKILFLKIKRKLNFELKRDDYTFAANAFSDIAERLNPLKKTVS